MAERLIDTSLLENTADAIRLKGFVGNIEYKSNGMADAINGLPVAEEYGWDLVIPKFPIGGRIFYDDGDNGATYTFYNASGNVISDTSISGLANATQYSVVGTPTKDRFYIYDNTTHTTGGVSVTGGITPESLMWDEDGYGASKIGTEDGIGKGKTNTATALSFKNWGSGNIWHYIKACNDANLNGCNDWFIASEAEQDKLRASGLIDWYNNKYV